MPGSQWRQIKEGTDLEPISAVYTCNAQSSICFMRINCPWIIEQLKPPKHCTPTDGLVGILPCSEGESRYRQILDELSYLPFWIPSCSSAQSQGFLFQPHGERDCTVLIYSNMDNIFLPPWDHPLHHLPCNFIFNLLKDVSFILLNEPTCPVSLSLSLSWALPLPSPWFCTQLRVTSA